MAMYHIPLYPSIRSFGGSRSERGREEWGPLFDRHNVEVAFENHDHALKRTHSLRDGRIVPSGEGTLYLGDGALGRGARPQPKDAAERTYLARAASIQHFWLVEEKEGELIYQAIDAAGRIVDSYPTVHADAEANFDRWAEEADAFARRENAAKRAAWDAGLGW